MAFFGEACGVNVRPRLFNCSLTTFAFSGDKPDETMGIPSRAIAIGQVPGLFLSLVEDSGNLGASRVGVV